MKIWEERYYGVLEISFIIFNKKRTMCINRETKPWSCCCGCSLKCGIITYAVFVVLELIGAFVTKQVGPIIFVVLSLIPLIALAIKPDSWGIRLWNYVWQIIMMAVVCIGGVIMVISAVGATAVAGSVGGAEAAGAVGSMMLVMLIIALSIMLPLQILWLCIFKAYFEELTLEKVGQLFEPLNQTGDQV